MNTIHKVPSSPIGVDARPVDLKAVDLGTTDPTPDGSVEQSRSKVLPRFLLRAAVCAASLALGAFAEHWALYSQGRYHVTLLAILLVPVVIIAFGTPEVVEAISRRHVARASLGAGLDGDLESPDRADDPRA